MKNTSFVAIDFETATNNRMACQIGIVVVENGQVVERVSKLIQPPHNRYDDVPMAIHHITPDMTKDSPTFDVLWPEIQHYFMNTHLVAHNAAFDESVLFLNLEYYGIMPMGILPFTCTCNLYHRIGLHDLCKAFEINSDGHHDALFDAECCAQFYLNFLNGVYPDYSLIKERKSKYDRLSAKKHLSGDILKKDLTDADPANPFYDRKLVITGEFHLDRKELANILKSMGADIDTAITKKTNFVLIGQEPGPSKMDKLNKLIHDGFPIRKIHQEDLDKILAGDYDGYMVDKTVTKDLDFSMKHYNKHHIEFVNGRNVISLKEIFFGKGLAGDVNLFYQICGNLGAAGDSHQIYPETNLILLSDSTLSKLEKGEKDETIQYIQNYYNSNKSIVFDFKFLSESDVLKFCKERCERCGDELTMDMYDRYMLSASKNNNDNILEPSAFDSHCINNSNSITEFEYELKCLSLGEKIIQTINQLNKGAELKIEFPWKVNSTPKLRILTADDIPVCYPGYRLGALWLKYQSRILSCYFKSIRCSSNGDRYMRVVVLFSGSLLDFEHMPNVKSCTEYVK